MNLSLDNVTAIELIGVITALTALLISIIALIYTIRTFLLKRGSNMRGSFSVSSSITCKDKYISEILLENQKDRSIAIYQIYLKISYNYYIIIEDFENKPLILKPFEVYKKEFDPIELYSVGLNRINLNNLIENKKIKINIILVTSEGKYKIKNDIKYWNPISILFKNHFTAIIDIRRLFFKERSYGEKTKYLIVLKNSDNREPTRNSQLGHLKFNYFSKATRKRCFSFSKLSAGDK